MLPENKGLLFSLALQCPFDLGCSDCPFKKIREIDIKERFVKIKTLNDSFCEALISKHYYNYSENFIYDSSKKRTNNCFHILRTS